MRQDVETRILPNGEEVVFYNDTHTYIVKGVVVPSITTLLKTVYGDTYSAVNPELLKRSADYGTAVHEELDTLINMRMNGFDIAPDLAMHQETRNYFKMVEPIYKIEPVMTEKIVVLYNDEGQPVAAGRFDLLCKVNGVLTLSDFKTTSTIHRQLVTAQLNLYLRACKQSGYIDSEDLNLGVIHLSGESCKYIPLAKLGAGFYQKFIK